MALPPGPPPNQDTWWPVDPAEITPGGLLVDRYQLTQRIGGGGGGEVFAAHDRLLDREVAVKWLRGADERRNQRELAALRRLQLPGVVRLLDEVVQDGVRYIIMERVEGLPFPGLESGDSPAERWEALEQPLRVLLDTLEAIHGTGLVHRDLKPSNVLVTADGQPVILDFGLARGTVLGSTITASGMLMGTPSYLAPEQLTGGRIDARTDLYALGTMLYEALTQELPFAPDAWLSRATQPAPSLAERAPALPAWLVGTVDALLSLKPTTRPPSAAAVRSALFGRPPQEHLPWLGPTAPTDALCTLIDGGHSVSVCGAPGSGRSRVVQEALRRESRSRPEAPAWILPVGGQPYESLATVAGVDLHAGDAPAQVEAALAAHVLSGGLVVLDPPAGVDRWSRGLVENGAGVVIRTAPLGEQAEGRWAQVRLEPLEESALRDLFWGPDRFLHLREDGAALLHQRAGGNPGRIAAELASWQSAGLTHWDEGRLRITRAALDRLATSRRLPVLPEAELDSELAQLLQWIRLAAPHANVSLLSMATGRPPWQVELVVVALRAEGAVVDGPNGALLPAARPEGAERWSGAERLLAHETLARLIPDGSPDRLFHLMAAGLAEEVAPAAVAVARQHRIQGRAGAATSLLLEALQHVRLEPEAPGEATLLRALLSASLDDGRAEVVVQAHNLAERAHADVGCITDLLAAASHVAHDRWEEARAVLEGLVEPEESDLAELYWELRVRVARHDGDERLEQVVSAATTWADAVVQGRPAVMSRVGAWKGHLAYRQGRYGESVGWFEGQGSRPEVPTVATVQALIHLARAQLELGDFEGVMELAGRAESLAARLRHPALEAEAHTYLRFANARGPGTLDPDSQVSIDAAHVAQKAWAGSIASADSWLALRQGDLVLAAELAELAIRFMGEAGIESAVLHARVVRWVATDTSARGSPEPLIDALIECPLADVSLHGLGLLAGTGLVLPAAAVSHARALLDTTPAHRRDISLAVLNPDEIQRRLDRRA